MTVVARIFRLLPTPGARWMLAAIINTKKKASPAPAKTVSFRIRLVISFSSLHSKKHYLGPRLGKVEGEVGVTGGIQQVRPRMTIEMEQTPMPSFNQAAVGTAEEPARNPSGSQPKQEGGKSQEKQEGKKTSI